MLSGKFSVIWTHSNTLRQVTVLVCLCCCKEIAEAGKFIKKKRFGSWSCKLYKKHECRPVMVAHAYNPRALGGWGRHITRSGIWDQPDRYGENLSLLKNTKISRAWWCVPVIPASWEAEAGRIAWAQEAEVAVSRDHAAALQPGQQNETPSQKI